MSKHYPPVYGDERFHRPFCNVYAKQEWSQAHRSGYPIPDLFVCDCAHCREDSIWYKEQMIFPDSGSAALPHEDMPDDVKADYDEARGIVAKSPRGAAGLLRLALQKLMPHLGEPGKNINDDIASLVKKGLPAQIQQACDTLRVVGNESVHPGEMDLNDTPEIAHALFDLVNMIVDVRIAQPKKLQELYGSLPTGKLKGIEDRDK